MRDGIPLSEAADVVRDLVASTVVAGGHPSLSQFLEILRRFERVRFDVPETVDGDGFLFQAGEVDRSSESTFMVGVTRQLEIVDSEGEHVCHFQIDMEFLYPLSPDLEIVESFAHWWFRDSGDNFSDWLEVVEGHAVWQRVANKASPEFAISASEV